MKPPYLDEHKDLHVTPAMYHEMHLLPENALATQRLMEILGETFYREKIEPELRARAFVRDALDALMDPDNKRWALLTGLRVIVDP